MESFSPTLAESSSSESHICSRTKSTLRLPHIPALDGVRGIASVGIVITHTLTNVQIPGGRAMALLNAESYRLALGVDLFFVLSGYLITTLLLVARRNHSYYRNFYIKRAFRILPALYLLLAIIVPILHFSISGAIVALLFVANFAFAWGVVDIGPFWTLAIEEQFYLLWPVVIRQFSPRWLVRILVATIVGCELVRAVAQLGDHGRIGMRILHFDGLAWGALVAVYAFRWKVPFRLNSQNNLWNKVYRYPLAWTLGMAFLSLVFHLFRFHSVDLSVTTASAIFALLILYLITHQQSRISKLFALAPLRFLGEISYMLYLSHAYWLVVIHLLIGKWLPPTTMISGYLLRAAICLGISIVWSALSLRYLERPVAGLRSHFLQDCSTENHHRPWIGNATPV
jgi:peptidoglycan/LPS O-acetylase OafA/YrhL